MLQYSALQGGYWMLFGTIYGFATVYLLSRGFGSAQIGACVAAGNIIGVILQPVLAGAADRSGKITVHRLTAILAALMFAALGMQCLVPDEILPVAVLFVLGDALLQILQPMVNSVSVYYINRGIAVDFGIARGIGSLAYAVAAAVLGTLIAQTGSKIVLVMGMVLLAVIIAVLYKMPVFESCAPKKKKQETKQEQRKGGFLKRYPYVMIASVGLTLLLLNHNMENNYLIQIITPLGGDSVSLGTTLSVAAVLEIPAMFLFTRMVRRIPSEKLVIISGVFFFAKAAAYLFCGNMAQMYLSQILQMGAFALYIPSTVYYVNEVMEPEDKFKGQAIMAGTSTLGGVFGSLLGGLLIDYLNVRYLLLFGTILAFTGMVTVFWAVPKTKATRGKD